MGLLEIMRFKVEARALHITLSGGEFINIPRAQVALNFKDAEEHRHRSSLEGAEEDSRFNKFVAR